MLFLGRGGARLQKSAISALSRCSLALQNVRGGWRGARRESRLEFLSYLAACKDTSKQRTIRNVYEEVPSPPRRRGASKEHSLASWAKNQTACSVGLNLVPPRARAQPTQRASSTHARTHARTPAPIVGRAGSPISASDQSTESRAGSRFNSRAPVQQRRGPRNKGTTHQPRAQQREQQATPERCPSSASRPAARFR